ncbi:hypothetical protein [Actinomadura sp. 6N118]|uniref:hypothetical protein n=1 Tax=Actinomadura sp. 6N118 TaxID=3375151 RepID=UPI0037A82D98
MVWTTQDQLAEARKRPQSAQGTLYGALKPIMDALGDNVRSNKALLEDLVQSDSLSAEVAKHYLVLIDGFAAANTMMDQTYSILLLARSLPQTYAYIDGAKLLVKTRRLAEEQFVGERLSKTDDIMDRVRDGFAEGSGGYGLLVAYQALGQRHTTIADDNQELQKHPYINQVSLAYTLLTFSYSPLASMQEQDIEIPQGEALLAWMGVWKIIGSAMGIEEGGLPDTFPQAQQLWELILASPGYGRSDEGVKLLQALRRHVLSNRGADSTTDLIEEQGDQAVLELLKS